MPKKWQNHWGRMDDQLQLDFRNRKLLTLGNLTIITQALNASIRDADWKTKRIGHGNKAGLKKYAEGIDTISEYLNLENWDESVIRERADCLCQQAVKAWSI